MIQPVKSSSSQPVMETDLLSHINAQQPQLDSNTYPDPPFSQGDNPHTLEDICQHFDIHEFLSFNFPEETSDIFTTNTQFPPFIDITECEFNSMPTEQSNFPKKSHLSMIQVQNLIRACNQSPSKNLMRFWSEQAIIPQTKKRITGGMN